MLRDTLAEKKGGGGGRGGGPRGEIERDAVYCEPRGVTRGRGEADCSRNFHQTVLLAKAVGRPGALGREEERKKERNKERKEERTRPRPVGPLIGTLNRVHQTREVSLLIHWL